ncbi:hypothetical protein [Paenibacillus sp. R14(2021)]|uniref:hypothetical protein n=1 Tax=Paenibacillus sp. R14(2021) TaxID=2859228 RepID=UPI002157ABD6|nr:hypothetical protein [Paenibacillus sp. R14(2021)]
METLTKAWFLKTESDTKQRSVELMKLHREQYGTSGNCFDLAIWLLHEFKHENISAYAVGHDLFTPNAHVAVVAVSERGHKYLCDLGDQWIEPVLIDQESSDFTEERLDDFFPGAQVDISVNGEDLRINYYRTNGKQSSQVYHLRPIQPETLIEAGEYSQKLLRKPLVESRIFSNNEITHWEFNDYQSFMSSKQGRTEESKLTMIDDWIERINNKAGINKEIIREALDKYHLRSSNA